MLGDSCCWFAKIFWILACLRVSILDTALGDAMKIQRLERLLVAIGLALLITCCAVWSYGNITSRPAIKQFLSQKIYAPLAILRIPRIELEVPVFNGTDDLTLDISIQSSWAVEFDGLTIRIWLIMFPSYPQRLSGR